MFDINDKIPKQYKSVLAFDSELDDWFKCILFKKKNKNRGHLFMDVLSGTVFRNVTHWSNLPKKP